MKPWAGVPRRVAAVTGSRRVGFAWPTSVGGPSFEGSACCHTAFVHFSPSKGSQCYNNIVVHRRSGNSVQGWEGIQLQLSSLRLGPAAQQRLVTAEQRKENSLQSQEGRSWLQAWRRPAATQHFVHVCTSTSLCITVHTQNISYHEFSNHRRAAVGCRLGGSLLPHSILFMSVQAQASASLYIRKISPTIINVFVYASLRISVEY
jgi:hypothetical protein